MYKILSVVLVLSLAIITCGDGNITKKKKGVDKVIKQLEETGCKINDTVETNQGAKYCSVTCEDVTFVVFQDQKTCLGQKDVANEKFLGSKYHIYVNPLKNVDGDVVYYSTESNNKEKMEIIKGYLK